VHLINGLANPAESRAVSGPPAGSYLAVSGQFLVTALSSGRASSDAP